MPDFFLDEIPSSSGNETSAKTAVESLESKVDHIFTIIKQNLSQEIVQSTRAIYQFNTTGK